MEPVGGPGTAPPDQAGHRGRQAGEVGLEVVLEVDEVRHSGQEVLVHVVFGEVVVEDGDVLGAVRDQVELTNSEIVLLQEVEEILQSLLQGRGLQELLGLTVVDLPPAVRPCAGLEEYLGRHVGVDVRGVEDGPQEVVVSAGSSDLYQLLIGPLQIIEHNSWPGHHPALPCSLLSTQLVSI